MTTYSITLTEAENKALLSIYASPQNWLEGLVRSQCAQRIDELVSAEINRKLLAGETISGTKDEIVLAATIETAAEREARLEAEFQERIAAQQGA